MPAKYGSGLDVATGVKSLVVKASLYGDCNSSEPVYNGCFSGVTCHSPSIIGAAPFFSAVLGEWRFPSDNSGICSWSHDPDELPSADKAADAPPTWFATVTSMYVKLSQTATYTISYYWYTWWGKITRPPSFKRHNLVNTQFIYMKIPDIIAEGILSLEIWI